MSAVRINNLLNADEWMSSTLVISTVVDPKFLADITRLGARQVW